MTDEQMRDLVKECGLDWQRGYMPLFDDDPTNRYAVLIEAVEAAERERAAKTCGCREGEIERLRTALQVVARHFSSDWPEPCKHSALTARQALCWGLGA